MIERRQLMTGAAAALAAGATSSFTASAFEWQTSHPSDAGFSPDLEARFDKLIADKRIWNQHGVIVIRGRRVVLERYFAGEQNNWGRLSTVDFTAHTPHNLYSVPRAWWRWSMAQRSPKAGC